MEQLFSDSECFQKERPKKLTEKQQKELYEQLAQQIIDEDWSSGDIEDIVKDLKNLSRRDSGYELAKELERSWNVSYTIKTDFIEWLDDFDRKHYEVISEYQKRWVKAHNIEPKIETGVELSINKSIGYCKELRLANTIFINGYDKEIGKYLVWPEKYSKRNYLINYEEIESNCTVIKR